MGFFWQTNALLDDRFRCVDPLADYGDLITLDLKRVGQRGFSPHCDDVLGQFDYLKLCSVASIGIMRTIQVGEKVGEHVSVRPTRVAQVVTENDRIDTTICKPNFIDHTTESRSTRTQLIVCDCRHRVIPEVFQSILGLMTEHYRKFLQYLLSVPNLTHQIGRGLDHVVYSLAHTKLYREGYPVRPEDEASLSYLGITSPSTYSWVLFFVLCPKPLLAFRVESAQGWQRKKVAM